MSIFLSNKNHPFLAIFITVIHATSEDCEFVAIVTVAVVMFVIHWVGDESYMPALWNFVLVVAIVECFDATLINDTGC